MLLLSSRPSIIILGNIVAPAQILDLTREQSTLKNFTNVEPSAVASP